MSLDLVIRNGTVVDGSGAPRYRADVGVVGDRIVAVGRIDERGQEEIDAEGHVVTPGFVDAHTHMDAQVFWDPLGTCSCWHGTTTVVMGNCGFTLAPAVAGQEQLVLANLERAEDIPAAAMAEGIDWCWDTFPSFLDAVDGQEKAINYAAQIGHSALRTFAMGERAFEEPATGDDLELMARTLEDALFAGAVGFTTSVSDHHLTSAGRPVASRLASKTELAALVEVVGAAGAGVFQLATDTESTESDDPERARAAYAELRQLAVATKVPVTFGLRSEHLDVQLEAFDTTAAAGGRLFGQSRSEPLTIVWSWRSRLPFDGLPVWRDERVRSLSDQEAALRDTERRRRLVGALDEAHPPDRSAALFEGLLVPADGRPAESLAALARRRRTTPVELMIDLALESGLGQVFTQVALWDDAELAKAMRHPWTVMTFSDAGAHVGMICGAPLPTVLLAHWVRERQEFSLEEAVRMLTLVPALAWGVADRGLVREGLVADLNVVDPATVAVTTPTVERDLPGGIPRVAQRARGYKATVVSGRPILVDGEPTGALPGRLLRGPLARPTA
ncbi:MAG TPA: amidohydrolase family protein [Acidimicrobiales bacterium]|nr:amidohydrolase family protein [Acidimicrobiales bacterium]